MSYLVGLFSLFFALLGMSAAQTAVALGITFLMHKHLGDKLPEKNYGNFSWDSFDRATLQTFIMRLAVIFVGATLTLHLLEYLIIYRYIILHWKAILFTLFILEMAAITAGFILVFKLEAFRLGILVGISAVVYIFFLWLLQWSNLLI